MRYFVQIAGTALLAYFSGWAYMLYLNPEIVFARQLAEEQVRQNTRTKSHDQRYIFIGGSSCSFSIDPNQLKEEFGVSAVNWGFNAGAGRGVHLETALFSARKGDVVVLALETSGWSDESDGYITPLGSQLWHGCLKEHFEKGSQLHMLDVEASYNPVFLRPGGRHVISLGAKMLLRKPLFRYPDETLGSGGYLKGLLTEWELESTKGLVDYDLSEERRALLQRFIDVMKTRGVEVMVSIPWHFVDDSIAHEQRAINEALASELSLYCPVIKDENLGVISDRSYFSDTHWHLSISGAKKRNRVVGNSIVEGLYH